MATKKVNKPKSSADEKSIKNECKEALRIFETGDHAKAIKYIDAACARNKNSALHHRMQGEIYIQAGLKNNIQSFKKKCSLKALESARIAVSLSQDSIECSLFYIRSLTACGHSQEAIQEGKRAFNIQNPIDPAELDFMDKLGKCPTRSERIAAVLQAIHDLVGIDHSSEQISDEQFEVKLVLSQNTRSDEVKEVVQTAKDERRKEIETRLAAARLMQTIQQNSVSPHESESHESQSGRSAGHKVENLRHFWNSMSPDERQHLLQVDTGDLLAHFRSSRLRMAPNVISEALSFGKANRYWKFLSCGGCDEIFACSQLYRDHVIQNHLGTLSPEHDSIFPSKPDQNWCSEICTGMWEPLNISAAPSADDSKRESLLESIHTALLWLLTHDFLTSEHLSKVMDNCMNKLEVLFPDSRVWDLSLYETQACICLMGISELKEILTFLEILLQKCKQRATSQKKIRDEILDVSSLQNNIKDWITLSGDTICLLPGDHIDRNNDTDYGASTASFPENIGLPNSNALFEWICRGPSNDEQLKLWLHQERVKKEQGITLHEMLEKNNQTIQKLCQKKCNLMISMEALKHVCAYLLNEIKVRKLHISHVHQSYQTLLQKWQENFGRGNHVLDRSMSEVTRVVLKEAQSRGFTSTDTSNLDIFEDGELAVPSSPDEVDVNIKEAITRIARFIHLELMKIDAWIRNTVEEQGKLCCKLELFAASDYRAILLPLVKSYILASLEKHMKSDLTRKSEVAAETNNAHVVSEDKKNISKGGKQQKQTKKKPKSKHSKKFINTMRSTDNEMSVPDQGTEEQTLPHDVGTHNHLDMENTGSMTDVDLKQEKDRLTFQAEEEEKMAKEQLEKIDRILDDYKKTIPVQNQKEVAVPPQHKMVTEVSHQEDIPGITATIMVKTIRTSNLSDSYVEEQTQSSSVAAGASIAIDQTDATTPSTSNPPKKSPLHLPSRCQMENVKVQKHIKDDFKKKHPGQKQTEATDLPQDNMVVEVTHQEDSPGPTETTTAKTMNNVGLGQQTQTTVTNDGASIKKVRKARDEDLALKGVIGLRGCSRNAAARLLALRWGAVMKAYEDPSTKFSEIPVMYSEPEVDFMAELRRAMAEENLKPLDEDK